MARNILILGASYGSLLATKLLMAGHNVTLVCRKKTAELINRDGTEVRIKLRDEAVHRAIFSRDLPGKLDATDARRCRPLPLRSGRPRDAGAAIHQPHDPRADGQDRRGEAAVPVDHEHAAAALSEADPGAGGHGPRRGLYQRAGVGALRAGTGDALLARSAGLPSAGRGGERAACRPADQLQGRGIRGRASTTSCCASWKPTSTR